MVLGGGGDGEGVRLLCPGRETVPDVLEEVETGFMFGGGGANEMRTFSERDRQL